MVSVNKSKQSTEALRSEIISAAQEVELLRSNLARSTQAVESLRDELAQSKEAEGCLRLQLAQMTEVAEAAGYEQIRQSQQDKQTEEDLRQQLSLRVHAEEKLCKDVQHATKMMHELDLLLTVMECVQEQKESKTQVMLSQGLLLRNFSLSYACLSAFSVHLCYRC